MLPFYPQRWGKGARCSKGSQDCKVCQEWLPPATAQDRVYTVKNYTWFRKAWTFGQSVHDVDLSQTKSYIQTDTDDRSGVSPRGVAGPDYWD